MTKRYPPGPRSFIGLQLARQLQRDLFAFSRALAAEYGDAVSFRCGPIRFFQFTHPDLVQEVLVKQAKKFHKPARVKKILGKWDGQGLVLSDGPLWIRQRRLVQQAFQPRRVESYADSMVAIAERMLDRWQAHSAIDVVDEMHRTTLDIVCKTLFGVDVADHEEIRHNVQELQETAMHELGGLVPLPDWLPLPSKRRFRNSIRYMKQLLDEIIEERRTTREDKGDLLSMLLLSVDEQGDGRGMSDQQARDETMTLLLAGHETTATTLVWTLYLLARHPQIQETAAREVAAALGSRRPQFHDLPRLTSVERVIKESMRLYPAVYFTSREAAEDLELAGWHIPRGSQVHLLPYAVYHDARWFTNPERFQPDRFTPEREEQLPAGAYTPFGAGPRMCIGKSMAMIEATLIVAAILQRYRLSLPAGEPEPEIQAQISLHPRGPLRIALAPRDGSRGATTPSPAESYR